MCTGTGINHDGFLIHFIERYYISKKQPVGVKHNSNGHVFDSRWVPSCTYSSVVERSIADSFLPLLICYLLFQLKYNDLLILLRLRLRQKGHFMLTDVEKVAGDLFQDST